MKSIKELIKNNIIIRFLIECLIPGFMICVPFICVFLFVVVPVGMLADVSGLASFVWLVISLIIGVSFLCWHSEDKKKRKENEGRI